MRFLRLYCQLLVGAGFLWIIFYASRMDTDWAAARFSKNSFMDHEDDENSPEKEFSCPAILQGERHALEEAKILSITKDFRNSLQIPDDYYINATKNCRSFTSSRKYAPFPLSKEEEDFPLAYSLVVHHKVSNFEKLLRTIYAPQNFYCIHVDKKAKDSVWSAISSIVSCFPNVFLASKRESVVYAHWSRVQADLTCMADLYNASSKWKYFINLCGQDFPLKTNLEIVRMLRALRGGNSMETENLSPGKTWRIRQVHEVINGVIQKTNKEKHPSPFNLPIMSGNAYMVVNRGYIHSVLKDDRIQALIEWFKDTYSPDEHLWATIQRMPGVPGSKWPNKKYDVTDINSIARLVKWVWHEGSQDSLAAVYPECEGTHVRAICVYGAGDLHWLIEQDHLFANKFDMNSDPIAIYCLEKYLRQKALSDME